MHSFRLACVLLLVCARPVQGQQHPLDPLTAGEIEIASTLLTGEPRFPAAANSRRSS